MKTEKHFTKWLLTEAARLGPEWGYNRRLDPNLVATLPDHNFPVVYKLVHEHRARRQCEPHMRCVLLVARKVPHLDHLDPAWESRHVIVDVPMEFYEALPEHEALPQVDEGD